MTSNLTQMSADLTKPAMEIRAELVRVDSKASTLLAVTGVALSVGLAVLGRGRLSHPATVTAWIATAAMGLAVGLLALAVRPRLRLANTTAGGFLRYVKATPQQLLNDELVTETPEQVIGLARLTHAKYLLVRGAVDLILVGLIATAATTILA